MSGRTVVLWLGGGLLVMSLASIPLALALRQNKSAPSADAPAPSAPKGGNTPTPASNTKGASTASAVDVVASRLADLTGKQGKRVELIGTVQAATVDLGTSDGDKSTPLLILNWSTGTEVYCRFPLSETRPAWWLTTERGQKIHVRGTVGALLPGMVFLEECEYVDSPR